MEVYDDYTKIKLLLDQIKSIYIETHSDNKINIDRKISNYHLGTKYIEQAGRLLKKIQEEIDNLDIDKINDISTYNKIDHLVDMLNNPKLSLIEAIQIYLDIKKCYSNIEQKTTVISNVKEETFVEVEPEFLIEKN